MLQKKIQPTYLQKHINNVTDTPYTDIGLQRKMFRKKLRCDVDKYFQLINFNDKK